MTVPSDFLYRTYQARPDRPADAAVSSYQWQFFTELDGFLTNLEIAHKLQYTEAACQAALRDLLDAHLIEEVLLTYHQYCGSFAVEPQSVALPAVVEPKRYLLHDAIAFICSFAGTGLDGKLAVYRIFLQIAPEALEAEGLVSFRMDDTTTEVKSAEIRRAICDAILRVVGVPFDWDEPMAKAY